MHFTNIITGIYFKKFQKRKRKRNIFNIDGWKKKSY